MSVEAPIVLTRRAIPQPSPALSPGGDCGACVLGGLLGIPVSEVYPRFMPDGKVEGFTFVDLRQALFTAQAYGLVDRLIDDIPQWHVYTGHQTWGSPGWCQNLAWFRYVRMALDAGYYGVTSIKYDGSGPFVATDHVVLIVGAREVRVPLGDVAARIDHELLVSCSASAPAGAWREVGRFLQRHGGFNVLLARPTGDPR